MLRRLLCIAGLVLIPNTMAASAQEYTRVSIGEPCDSDVYTSTGRCIHNPTPEQRRQQDLRRKQAEREKLELERRQAETKRKVDDRLTQMGGNPARRAEAERFVKMQEDAAAARNRLAGNSTQQQPPMKPLPLYPKDCFKEPPAAGCPTGSKEPRKVTPQ